MCILIIAYSFILTFVMCTFTIVYSLILIFVICIFIIVYSLIFTFVMCSFYYCVFSPIYIYDVYFITVHVLIQYVY